MARIEDLHQLPKFRDALSFVYVEHARIDQHEKSIAIHDDEGMTPIPIASTAVLLLGPGTRVTHAAMVAIADNNALAVWVGEAGVRCYAHGMGGTRSSAALIRQATLATNEASRLAVVQCMYRMRFAEEMDAGLTVEQLRGMEGIRVRNTYARFSEDTGVAWSGRNYNRDNWHAADPVNRALSAANSCLYGLCHAGIIAMGYSPALGFIHTGKQLSFVYDIGDLYKTEISIPLAFQMAQEDPPNIERATRLRCRDIFKERKLLPRIVQDLRELLGSDAEEEFAADSDPALPTTLWTPDAELATAQED
ncbi:MAG TPA: type I-E CRISPR-associated endonuclease Cas1e [Armatimonadota bacterium]|nr:type I-E CRISPR-associated endonuclease Cas1e [Armatimonadota bacterium]